MRPAARLAREPLVQFLALGAGLFALHAAFAPEGEPPAGRIVIDAGTIAMLEERHARTWGAQPPVDDATRARLIEGLIAEEVLFREALALGLERDDATIRRRLGQKVLFLLQDGLALAPPGEAELRAFFAAHAERYREPARISFEQVFLGSGAEAQMWQTAAARPAVVDVADPAALGQPSILPPALDDATTEGIDRVFGEGFADGIAALAPGRWQGPVESAFGLHLVRLVAIIPGRPAAFEAVRDRVEADFAEERARRAEGALMSRLRARYEIVIEGGGE